MYRLTVMYNQPTDPAAFDDHYTNTHMPLARAIPGLRSVSISKAESLDGSQPAIYQVTTLDFDSKEAFGAGMASDAGQATSADVPNFASGGVSMIGAEVVVEDLG